ncbi:MAG: hypothetical protein NWR45_07100 [Candidatus Nanopelagicales bacterium]|nr:hypothetical protein [Candidatus Nanopelagicales bacterium]
MSDKEIEIGDDITIDVIVDENNVVMGAVSDEVLVITSEDGSIVDETIDVLDADGSLLMEDEKISVYDADGNLVAESETIAIALDPDATS